jgi:hypothetical protein
MSIIGFEGAVIATYIDGLAVVRGQGPVAARLLQATTHGGLLAAIGS